jgi:hypothetical protein
LRLFSVSPIENKTERSPFWHKLGDRGRIAEVLNTLTENDFQVHLRNGNKIWLKGN